MGKKEVVQPVSDCTRKTNVFGTGAMEAFEPRIKPLCDAQLRPVSRRVGLFCRLQRDEIPQIEVVFQCAGFTDKARFAVRQGFFVAAVNSELKARFRQ